jgi:D-alanyl-D-alanine carboxypeptidase
MTSGIPDYTAQDAFGEVFVSDPTTAFTPERLVSFVAGLPLGTAICVMLGKPVPAN